MVGARWSYPASSCVELLILALYFFRQNEVRGRDSAA
jgi:hypothetical protein